MAVPHNWFSASAEALLATLWVNNPKKVALMQASFVPNRDTQKVWADVSASELAAGGGYTAGGLVLANKSAPYDASSDTTHLYADDASWGPSASFTTAYAVVYDSNSPFTLWSLVDFQGAKQVINGTFTIDFDALGLLDVIAA